MPLPVDSHLGECFCPERTPAHERRAGPPPSKLAPAWRDRPQAEGCTSERLGVRVATLAVLVMAAWMPTAASADASYPNRPVKLLLGFTAGGGSDMVARLIAKSLGERLGQPVVVDNKPGAGGNIAAEAAAKAAPDGYTLILLPSGHASNAAMKKTLPFDPVAGFAWISTVTTYPVVLSVAPASPIKSFADFLARSKAEPGKYSYSSVGVGTAMHLVGESIMADAGSSAIHVPFKGGSAPITELLAGRVDVMVDTMTNSAPLLADKRLRAIATTSPKGQSTLPGVPAVADVLPGGIEFESWLGVATTAGTPPDVLERLNREMRAVIAQPAVQKQLTDWGGAAKASSPAEFRARVERDIIALRKVVADRRIETEP